MLIMDISTIRINVLQEFPEGRGLGSFLYYHLLTMLTPLLTH